MLSLFLLLILFFRLCTCSMRSMDGVINSSYPFLSTRSCDASMVSAFHSSPAVQVRRNTFCCSFLTPLLHGVICTHCPSSSFDSRNKDYSSDLHCSGLVSLGPWRSQVAEQLPSAHGRSLIYIDYTRALALLNWQLTPAGFNDTLAALRCCAVTRMLAFDADMNWAIYIADKVCPA
jgi:hypothetical protein